MEKIEKLLRNAFSLPLPGFFSHKEMAPPHRIETIQYCPAEAKHSAVLVVLSPASDILDLQILFMKRTKDGFAHSAQVSFPGGRFEENDINYFSTALREAFEECGIISELCTPIGKLSNLFIPPSHFYVHPFVVLYKGKIDLDIKNNEVDFLFTASIKQLLMSKTCVSMSINNESLSIPAFQIENQIIWGATAMILNELLFILQDLVP